MSSTVNSSVYISFTNGSDIIEREAAFQVVDSALVGKPVQRRLAISRTAPEEWKAHTAFFFTAL